MSELQPYVAPESALVEWANSARAAHSIAQSLASTPFVSSTMRGKPHEVTAAILTGQEIGLQPMSALRSIDVIQGTPAIRAVAMRGLVQSHGHELWIDTATDTKAVVKGRRRGTTEVQSSTWTIERAQRLGLATKENWRKQPGSMLVARATAECARYIASDVLLGIPYAIEELDDESAPVEPVKRRRAKVPRTTELGYPPEPAAIPAQSEPVDEPVDEELAVEPVDEAPEPPEPEL